LIFILIGNEVKLLYYKQFYVFNQNKPLPAVIRNYTEADFDALIDIQSECFPPPFPEELWWNLEQLKNHITLFSEGALCIEVDGKLVGSMTTLLVDFDPSNALHTWEDITDNGYITTHKQDGNTLYVVDISVRPTYRNFGLGKWMMLSMYELVVQLGLERLLGGSRMPGYHKYAKDLTAEEYVKEVVTGVIYDPVISFLLRCGRTPIQVVKEYLQDEESCHNGVLMEWKNPFKNHTTEGEISHAIPSHHTH
jgi:ribosomal protein S18 acetylase RimI-like enzyme